ncbi:uncharacterized protein LOC135932010 isoform X2 [Gordionus sp. m RMFG-2023]|uniref:uncharacterized protein LOC135932010 isoform X2 n=1 Tax=Gordionus sp. m RMFG-2023 TaxID=3053472 RepID=UPI0031FE007C
MSNYEKNTFSNYYISRSKPHHDPIYKYKTITYNCKRGGTQVKIPETTNLYSQYHFQNIPKNLVPMSRTIPDSTQVKIPETTNLYSQYHFQNIPKNLGPQSKTIPATFEFYSSQNISKNILGTQIKLPNTTKTLDYTGYSLQNIFRKP